MQQRSPTVWHAFSPVLLGLPVTGVTPAPGQLRFAEPEGTRRIGSGFKMMTTILSPVTFKRRPLQGENMAASFALSKFKSSHKGEVTKKGLVTSSVKFYRLCSQQAPHLA